jgi:predicted enzyme related to lactoylglutathione lyase
MAVRELFLVELRVGDRARMAAWYQSVLGLTVELDDPEGDFSLLAAGPTRLAIKGGCDAPATGSVALVFLVDHLADEHRRLIEAGIVVSEIETSVEGYRAVRLSDPAGHPIQLFEWIRPV